MSQELICLQTFFFSDQQNTLENSVGNGNGNYLPPCTDAGWWSDVWTLVPTTMSSEVRSACAMMFSYLNEGMYFAEIVEAFTCVDGLRETGKTLPNCRLAGGLNTMRFFDVRNFFCGSNF